MKCNICLSETKNLFKGRILNKYQINYYKCPRCGFIQTEKPFWLDEVYVSAITDLDVGLVLRNVDYSKEIEKILKNSFDYNKKFLDYAGGYGLFVRIMRDKGFDFYREDKYCDNIFAKHFDIEDISKNTRFEAITAFEVFEHLENPMEELEDILNYSDTLIFSTELHPNEKMTSNEDWWYFTPETGQHISFYSKKTLQYIADKYHLSLYSDGSLHLLSKKKFKKNPLATKGTTFNKNTAEIKSLTQSDYELIKKAIKKASKIEKNLDLIDNGQKQQNIDRNQEFLNRLSLALAQLDIISTELSETKSRFQTTKLALNTTQSELDMVANQLELVSAELNKIYISRGWRIASILWKLSKILMPPDSFRRKAVGNLFRVTKRIVKALLRVSNKVTELFLFSEVFFINLTPRKKRKINKKSRKIVYIGHSYHNKTKSTAFLIDYLKEFYDVQVILDESWQGKPFPDLSFIDAGYLGVIFFQNLPSKKVIDEIKNDNLIFFPMYDAHVNHRYKDWKKWRAFKIMNFSSTLHKRLLKWGFESDYVQYFPEPSDFIKGSKDEVFFWQRITAISINEVAKLLKRSNLKVHIHKAVDPHQSFIKPTKEMEKNLHITYSEWFEKREEMWEVIKQSAIYIAPRVYEGIGMSFLEAMAMGKAVVAVDNPTMNEYIEDNKTGYLFDLKDPQSIDLSNIIEVQKNTYKYMHDGYKKWEKDKKRIIKFIEKE